MVNLPIEYNEPIYELLLGLGFSLDEIAVFAEDQAVLQQVKDLYDIR